MKISRLVTILIIILLPCSASAQDVELCKRAVIRQINKIRQIQLVSDPALAPDNDPTTLQILFVPKDDPRHAKVTNDGQVIYESRELLDAKDTASEDMRHDLMFGAYVLQSIAQNPKSPCRKK